MVLIFMAQLAMADQDIRCVYEESLGAGPVFSAVPHTAPLLVHQEQLDLSTVQLELALDGGVTPWTAQVQQEEVGGGMWLLRPSEPWPLDRELVLIRQSRTVWSQVVVEDLPVAVPAPLDQLDVRSWRQRNSCLGRGDLYRIDLGEMPPLRAVFEVQASDTSDFVEAASTWHLESWWINVLRPSGSEAPYLRARMWVMPGIAGPWTEAVLAEAPGCSTTGRPASAAWLLGLLVLLRRGRRLDVRTPAAPEQLTLSR